jgi:hypothetical protein
VAHKWRWLGPIYGDGERNRSSTAWHVLFGVISSGLALLQPLNSLFRCDPSDNRRTVFNWIHRFIGLISWAFAAICISIACCCFGKRFVSRDVAFVLCLTIILATLIFGVFMEVLSRRRDRIDEFVFSNAEITFRPKISFIIFVFILILLVVSLCLQVWLKRVSK